jgi:hypothetical protein
VSRIKTITEWVSGVVTLMTTAVAAVVLLFQPGDKVDDIHFALFTARSLIPEMCFVIIVAAIVLVGLRSGVFLAIWNLYMRRYRGREKRLPYITVDIVGGIATVTAIVIVVHGDLWSFARSEYHYLREGIYRDYRKTVVQSVQELEWSGQYAQAAARLRELLERYPDDPRNGSFKGRQGYLNGLVAYSETMRQLGDRFRDENPREAIRYYVESLRTNPGDEVLFSTLTTWAEKLQEAHTAVSRLYKACEEADQVTFTEITQSGWFLFERKFYDVISRDRGTMQAFCGQLRIEQSSAVEERVLSSWNWQILKATLKAATEQERRERVAAYIEYRKTLERAEAGCLMERDKYLPLGISFFQLVVTGRPVPSANTYETCETP